MKRVRAVVSLVLAAAAFWALDNRHGTFPALGRLLDPFAGFWQNGSPVGRHPADARRARPARGGPGRLG